MPTNTTQIILASSSIYRQQLLAKLGLSFSCTSPDIDETPLPDENIIDMVMRLAHSKAEAIIKQHPNAIIIASDQSASLDNKAIGKAGNFNNALNQLKSLQGKTIDFHTGLTVYNPANQEYLKALDTTKVHFRNLSEQQLENYLLTEQPYDCAGSFKSEGLGIVLFSKIETQDPNALIGLPLIKLVELLDEIGLKLPLKPINQITF